MCEIFCFNFSTVLSKIRVHSADSTRLLLLKSIIDRPTHHDAIKMKSRPSLFLVTT